MIDFVLLNPIELEDNSVYTMCTYSGSGRMTPPYYSLTLLPRVPSLLSTEVKVLTMESRDLGCMPLWTIWEVQELWSMWKSLESTV